MPSKASAKTALNGRLSRVLIYREALGVFGFLRYRYSRETRVVQAIFAGQTVLLRSGTPDLGVALSCFAYGEFEELTLFLERDFSGTIIDAGAHIGCSALALSNLFPAAKVIAVEPQSDNFVMLKQNVFFNPRIVPVHGALVGSEAKLVSLRDRGTGEVGFTVVSTPKDNPKSEIVEKVPAFRLRDLVHELEEVGLLKLDIEGGEFELLTKDLESVKKIPLVVAELHDRIKEGCTAAFEQMSEGRTIHKLWGEKLLSVKRASCTIEPVVGTAERM